MAASKSPQPQSSTSLDLGQLLTGLAAIKSPALYLQTLCKLLHQTLKLPVSGFILHGPYTDDLVAEQLLPANLRGKISYPKDSAALKDITAWPENSALPSIAKHLGTPRLHALKWHDQPLGGLVVWQPPGHIIEAENEKSLQLVMGLAATGLKTLLLEQAANNSTAEAHTLQKITQAITGSLDFEKVSTALLQNAKNFFRVDAAALALAEPDSNHYTVKQAIGLSKDYIANLRVSKSNPIVKQLIKSRGPVQLENLHAESTSKDIKLATKEGITSLLLIPIFSDGQPVGSLGLISKTKRIFSPAEMRFGQSLAKYAGIALTNAALHANLQKTSYEVEQTRNFMRDGLLVFGTDRRLHYFNTAAATALDLSREDLYKVFPPSSFKQKSGLKINRAEVERVLSDALRGNSSRTTFSVKKIDREEYYEAVYSPYRDNTKHIIGALMSIRDITALYLEKEKLQAIQNSISDGLILIDKDGSTIEYNDEWAQLFNVQESIIGQPFGEFFAERKNFTSDRDPRESTRNALKGKHHTYYVHDLERTRHMQISISPITTNGQVSGAVATARDITPLIEKTVESNEMAAKAHRHLQELSQLAELSSIVGFNVTNIYQKNLSKTATLLKSSSVALYLYHAARQQLTQDQAVNPHPKDPKSLDLGAEHLVTQAFSSRQPATAPGYEAATHRLALPITHHSKTLGVLLVSRSQEIYGEHEAKLLKMVATRLAVLIENANLYHDVNARRERWEAVFRFTEEGIVIFDRNGVIVGFNPACTQITQFHPADAIGKSFDKIIKTVGPDNLSASTVSPIDRVLREGVTIAKSERLIENRSGGRVWTEISYSPIFDDGGRVTSGIAIIRNTTRDREVEEIKSDFISIVSHELRTPLTAIKGFLSMTLKNDFGALSEKQFHYLSRVYQSNQRMIDLVEDLMDATYIESGKITLSIAPVALDNIVSNVVTELAAKGAASNIMINIRRRQKLPLVLADETRLHQIVLNLVDNAIKYSMPSTEVNISFRIQNDELITTVTDHGVGIGKSQIERLFTKFGRIFNPLSVQAGGTGLGLYIVKNLVEAHDGRIWVTSIEGKGSKFNFSVPIAKQLPLIE